MLLKWDGCSIPGSSLRGLAANAHLRAAFFLILLLCIAPLSAHSADTPKWVITKSGGAYRVNGMKLMANGYLRSEKGDYSKELTREEVIEIGNAIEAYESGVPPPVTNTSANTDTVPAENVNVPPPQIEQPPPVPSTPQEPVSNVEIGIFVGILVCLLAATVIFMKRPRCPKCGRRSLSKVEFVNDEDDDESEPGFECNGCGHQWTVDTR